METMTLVFTCVQCRAQSTACPNCVNTVRIDPETGLPPDVRLEGGKAINVVASAAATERSEKEPFCDGCAARRGVTTAEERHRRGGCVVHAGGL